jgi:2'-5' RNA ligase
MSLRTIIVALPPDDIQRGIEILANLYKQRFGDPCRSSLPVHITIIQPFSGEIIPSTLAAIHNQAFPEGPITVTCTGYGTFSQKKCTIFGECESPDLGQTRRQLIAMLPPDIRKDIDHVFKPHITIARRVAHVTLEKAMVLLEHHDKLHCTFTVDRLSVYQQKSPRDPWQPFSQ